MISVYLLLDCLQESGAVPENRNLVNISQPNPLTLYINMVRKIYFSLAQAQSSLIDDAEKLVNRNYIEKNPPKVANADGTDGKQGGKVFSIQLFSFKKLLFRYDGLNLRVYNSQKMYIFTIVKQLRRSGVNKRKKGNKKPWLPNQQPRPIMLESKFNIEIRSARSSPPGSYERKSGSGAQPSSLPERRAHQPPQGMPSVQRGNEPHRARSRGSSPSLEPLSRV